MGSPENQEIAVELPESWLLRQRDPFRYQDPSTPQYALIVSVVRGPQTNEELVAYMKRILAMISPDAEPRMLTPTRAMAHYGSVFPAEGGHPKDDRNWMIAERRDRQIQHALFTLSVLEARADKPATEALTSDFTRRIEQAQFLA